MPQTKWISLFFLFIILLAACQVSPPVPDPPPTSETAGAAQAVWEPAIDLDAIPSVDVSQHSVPLEEIYFDTFQPTNRAVPLTEASPRLIRSLLDAIPPIYSPKFESVEAANGWLREDDLVLGYADGEEAYAYAVRILNFHEIVSHEVNGRSVMATYCPLCRSGVVYDRVVDGETLLFGNTSALYESDMVMLDHATGSYWVQVSGAAVVGPLTGRQLTALPSQTTTWAAWRGLHPETLVLSRDTGHRRNYSRDPFVGYAERLNETGQFAFPVTEAALDARLVPGAVVLGVEVGEKTAAYPLEEAGDGVRNDVVGETAVVIFTASSGPAGAAYLSDVEGQSLTFVWENGQIVDEQTGSVWLFSGEAIAGELVGTTLTPLPVRTSFWFALIAAFPELELR